MIKIPVDIGSIVLFGKFKNKRTTIKSIEWNEKGDLLINNRPALKFRIPPSPKPENEMKLSEFKKLIREEIKKVLNENKIKKK